MLTDEYRMKLNHPGFLILIACAHDRTAVTKEYHESYSVG